MQSDTPTYDLRAIMQEAWGIVRRHIANGNRDALRVLLARALRHAWWKAKQSVFVAMRARSAQRQAATLSSRPVSSLRAEIEDMENRSRLGAEGLDRLGELRTALAAAEARENESKREIIVGSAGRFCRVVFTKKDGTIRHMTVQPAALKFHVKGESASDAGRKAAATRAERHPHLMPVWDAEKKAPRSINLSTVSQITAGGETHVF